MAHVARAILMAAIAIAAVLPCAAQTVNSVHLQKARNYLQSSPSDIAPDPIGSPLGFGADVPGSNLAGTSPPTPSGPVNLTYLGCFWNGGQLVYSTQQTRWRIGTPNAAALTSPLPINFDWSSQTQSDLDAIFSNGVYTVSFNGINVALNMAGDLYPAPPVLSLSGGTWRNGIYVIDVTQPFTVTATFTGFGAHMSDVIALSASNVQTILRVAAESTANTLTLVIPANSYPNNDTPGVLQAIFEVNADTNNSTALAMGVAAATYATSTYVIVNSSSTASPFPMVVNRNIRASTACATAAIQPRSQEIGTTQSVFVFAHAPSSIVKSAIAKRVDATPIPALKDDAVVCVLAQLGADGQLHAVSASTMQAYLTAVLSSQSSLINILNNVSTTSVAGSTLFVGYGTSAAGMLSSGLFQNAASIPGAVQCTGSLTSAAAAKSPGALSGLWWNAAESGWGIHYTQRGSNTFAAWYTYDALGNPKWYVSTCAGFSGTSGTCNGTLYEVTGPNFFGGAFNPSLVNTTSAGTLQVTFANANAASMTYTVAGQTRTVALTRQPLATGAIPPAIDYTDLWWNPGESGWGMAMTQQFGITFLAWYVYDANGKPTWEVATCTMSGSSCSGTLYRTTGPPFGPTFDPNRVHATAVGSVIVSFIGANDAVLSYTIGGVTATKTITRQLF